MEAGLGITIKDMENPDFNQCIILPFTIFSLPHGILSRSQYYSHIFNIVVVV